MTAALAFDTITNGDDPRTRLRKMAGDTTVNKPNSDDGALARLRALAGSNDGSVKTIKEPTVIPIHKPAVVRAVRPPSIVAARDATNVSGNRRTTNSEPGIFERAGAGISAAIEETINHPVRTIVSLVEAPISSAYKAVFAPSVGELPYDLRLTKGGNSRGQTQLERNTPYTKERGAVTDRERTEAAVQTLANIAAGPIAGKVTRIASPTVGQALGRTLGTVTAGAAANAAYTPDDPAAGAISGAVLGGLLHVAGEGAVKGTRGIANVAKRGTQLARDAREASTLRAQLKEVTEARNVAEREANVDALTGVANRNAYTKALTTAEADPNTSVVRFDVNGFKRVNDTFGHSVGDEELKQVAKAITEAATEQGVGRRVFRVGGDEFAVLAPKDKAPLLRDRAEQLYGIKEHGNDTRTSISGGVGLTDAEADAISYSRKGLHKIEQEIQSRVDTPPQQIATEQAAINPPNGINRIKTNDIAVDPERFQFKRNTDPETGAGSELKRVEKFNEQLAGVISVWRDPANGKIYVVNGHHRVELAKRVNHPDLNVQFIDALTAQEARATGAMMNIAEGRGTPVDVAKFLRDTGMNADVLTEQGISLRGTLAKHGVALSKLAPDVFDRVARGDVPEGHGVAIGETLEDPTLQRTAINVIDKSGKRLNDSEVREVARQVRDAGTEKVSQETLFGTEEIQHALIIERAQLASAIKKRLANDKRTFGYVAKEGRASELERGGNVINLETSRAIAQESARLEEIFNTLYNRSGPVSDVLTEGARRIARGEKPNTVIDELYPDIRARVSEAITGRHDTSGEPPTGGTGGGRVEGEQGGPSIRDRDEANATETDLDGPALNTSDPNQTGFFSPASSSKYGVSSDTKVIDTQGEPRIVYHGTGSTFETFDLGQAEPNGLFGPGLYFTEDPRVAGGMDSAAGYSNKTKTNDTNARVAAYEYRLRLQLTEAERQVHDWKPTKDGPSLSDLQLEANDARYQLEQYRERHKGELEQSTHAPNVRMARLSITNPFDADAIIPYKEQERLLTIANAASENLRMTRRMAEHNPDGGISGNGVYEELTMATGSKAKTNELLQEAGYDGITYKVDSVTGGLEHKVWIAFTEEQARAPFNPELLASPEPEINPFSTIQERTRFGARVRKLIGKNDPEAKADVKALIKISRGLAEAVGVPLAQGRFNAVQRKALGVFFPHAETTRVRRFDMLDTVSHEVGHYISKKHLGNPTNVGAESRSATPLSKEMKAELVKMGRDLYGNRKPNGGYGEEGIAQWARFYVTEPERLLKDAPRFSAMMEQQVLSKELALRAALDQARSDFERYTEVPANARIASMISVNERVRNMPTLRSLTTSWVDDLHEFRVAMNELGSTDDPRKDAYTLSRLTRGAAGAAEEMIERGVTDFNTGQRITNGIFDTLRSIPANRIQAFREYLTSERAIEKWGQGINTGIALDDATTVAKNGRPEFEKAAQVLWEHSQALLRYRRDAGLLTAIEYKVIAERNQRRVGFYRVFDENETASPKAWGKQKARNSSGIYAMKGSARLIIDPLESVISDTYKTIAQARAHHAASQLLELALKTEGAGHIAEEVPAPTRPVSVSLEQVKQQLMDLGIEFPHAGLDDYSGTYLTAFEDMVVPGPNETRDLVIPIVKQGKRIWVAVRDRRLYDAVKGLQKEEMTDLMRMLSFPARTLRTGATLTPEFIGRNPVRDMWSAAVYSRAGYRPPGWNFAKGMFHYLKADDVYQRWKLEGGDNATMLGLDRPQIQKRLRDVLASKERKALNIVVHPIDTLRMVSSLMENATRIGEYAAVETKLLKKGASARAAGTEAALASRDVSIDFPRAGTKSRAINQIVAFFNASIQSTAKLFSELKTRPQVILPRVLASVTLPSIYLYLTQKDDPTYQELPRWQKDLFWIIIDRDSEGTLQHIWRIPKSFELGVLFGTVPERILEYAGKHDPEAIDNALSAVQRAFTPPVWPTAISPLIENWANHSTYTDRPIVPRTTEGLDPGFQAASYTGETARAIGEAVDYSPAKIENAVRGYFGGLGEYALRGTDAGVRAVRNAKKLPSMTPGLDTRTDRLDRIPAARAFIAREPGSDAESVERIYRKFEEAERKRRTWRVLREQGRIGEAEKFFKTHRAEILSVATKDETGGEPGHLRAAYQTLQKFGEGRKGITSSRANPTDKATRVRALDRRLVNYARQQRERLFR